MTWQRAKYYGPANVSSTRPGPVPLNNNYHRPGSFEGQLKPVSANPLKKWLTRNDHIDSILLLIYGERHFSEKRFKGMH
jgi:hypothetical protein